MKRAIFLLGTLIFPIAVFAHDFWIEPSTYHPRRGEFVQIRLRVGQQYLGDPVPRKPENELVRFDVITPAETVPVMGTAGRDPAGVFRVEDEGMMIVAYNNTPSFIEVPPEKLTTYLGDEGLEKIAASWMKSFAGKKPWREIYSRCAKSLLLTGSDSSDLYSKALGLPLEIVPEKNPYALGSKKTLPVRLLYRGKPLAGALIIAVPRLDPKNRIAIRSNAKGRVEFNLPHNGEWLIKAVHLFPAAAGAQGEWESLWASLTFDMP